MRLIEQQWIIYRIDYFGIPCDIYFFVYLYCGLNKTCVWIQTWSWFVNFLVCVLLVFRDQDLAEALDSSSSDMEMEKGMVQVQEQSAQHRAKMWKVIRNINTQKLIYLICKRVRNKLKTEVIPRGQSGDFLLSDTMEQTGKTRQAYRAQMM